MRTWWHRRANISVATPVSKLAPDADPTVSVDNNNVITFGIPQGETGATGATPNITIGTVTKGAAGSDPDVSLDEESTPEAPIFNFTIPQGAKGDTGDFQANAAAENIPMVVGGTEKISERIASMPQSVTRYALTFTTAGWSQNQEDNSFSQTVAPTGYTYSSSTKDCRIDVDLSETTATQAKQRLNDWSGVGRVTIGASGVTAICYKVCPSYDLPAILTVVI